MMNKVSNKLLLGVSCVMMKRVYLFLCTILLLTACSSQKDATVSEELPPIYPDYANVTIPVNIAPLNFLLRNQPETVEVSLKGKTSNLLIRSKQKVQFPEGKWRSILEAEAGGHITVQISAKVDGQWIEYAPFRWTVTADKVDPWLSYRLIEPGYEVWNAIQLRERNLESFRENVIADNNLTEQSCMNCHIYGRQDPNLSLFHLRGAKGGTVLNRDGKLRKLHTKAGSMPGALAYGELHPTGRYGVFSSNIVIPSFHSYRSERLEVYDEESDIYIIDFDLNTIHPFPHPATGDQPFRTFPVFSGDGRSVYYCEAPRATLPDEVKNLRYSLCRIGFDPETGMFGNQIDTVYNATPGNQSVCFPKASPDGKYLLYTLADYGTFPIWHREADLQLLDLSTGVVDSLQVVNAPCSDTYHSWSSNSRWFVFASKRDDGVYGKPYFCYIDSAGVAHKPFVLPQKDPAFYDYTLKSFNIPELATGALPFGAMDIERLYYELDAEPVTISEK